MTTHLWTWTGIDFGYRDGDELWCHDGRHVGRFHGDEVYAPDGSYLGELRHDDRLISKPARRSQRRKAAAAVRGPKHVVKTGKTPVLEAAEWRKLIDSIPTATC